MGNIRKQIEMYRDLFKGNDKGMYQLMLDNLQEIEISPMEEVFSPAEIRKIKSRVKPKKKECYKNAFDLCMMFPDKVEYCEGYFTCYGLPLEHAFNKVGDKYVDITGEWVLKNKIGDNEYATIVVCDYREAAEIAVNTGYYGNVFQERFIEQMKRNG